MGGGGEEGGLVGGDGGDQSCEVGVAGAGVEVMRGGGKVGLRKGAQGGEREG